MLRMLLDTPYTCYVCGTQFTINNDGFPRVGAERAQVNCPCCTAPEKQPLPLTGHLGMSLVGIYYGGSLYCKQFATVEQFFADGLILDASIDACLEQVIQIDYQAWQRYARVVLADSDDPDSQRDARDDLRIIKLARQDAQNGTLLPALHALAEQAKAQLRAERERYLRIYRQRCGAGQMFPKLVYRYLQEPLSV